MSKYLIGGLVLAGHGLAFSGQHIPRPTLPPKFVLPAQIKAAPAPTTAASAGEDQQRGGGDDVAEACRTANSLAAYCASAIPEIQFASPYEIAACLCCDGAEFEPEYFDDSAMSCANFISSAAPESSSEYSAWSTLGNFCGGGGLEGVCSKTKPTETTGSVSFKTAAAGPVTSTANAATTAAPAADAEDDDDDDCDFLATIGNSCALQTRGFERLPLSSQAECLCYMTDRSTTTWVPDVFDGAFGSCSDHVSTAWTQFRPSRLSAYEDLCSSMGDFLVASADATTTAAESTGTATVGAEGSSETASESATAVTVTVTPSSTAEPDNAAAGGLGLPAMWPVVMGAVLGAVVLVL
ncbi:hypothetical protein DL771_008099 [Monosporascus sp. 5C6A]|nr:hypothetical protein DL771_008099 [Monosporascus sp. 5C6A]